MNDSFLVVSTDAKGIHKRVTLEDSKGARTFHSFPRFAQLSKNDYVHFDPEHPSRVSVEPADPATTRIRITPLFEQHFTVRLGSESLKGRIAEVSTAEDLENYNFLESFHYRSSVSPLELMGEEETDEASIETAQEEPTTQPSKGGRKAILLCSLQIGKRWHAVGYIELQMPLLMVKPRHEIFSLPFVHSERAVRWDVWDQHAIRAYVNLIVRIARVVTSPEYRGLGFPRFPGHIQ